MPTINTSLAPSLPLGSPTRGLHARQQSPRTLLRHRQPGFNAYDTPCKAWIADTLHQLHKSTVPRAALFSTGRQSELCKICRTPLSGASPQRACSGSPNSQSRPLRRNTLCYSVAAELQTSTAGGDSGPPGGRSGDGGGGGGGSNDPHNNAVTASQTPLRETMSAQGLEDIILFDVQGMKCGGCVSEVKRILEQHTSVTQATVNLATETALVRAALPESSSTNESGPHGMRLQTLGSELAQALSQAGFNSTVRSAEDATGASNHIVRRKREERKRRLKEATGRLVLAWLLASACLTGHLGHLWHGAPAWLHFFGRPPVHAAMSALALLGPGRQLLVDGWKAWRRGSPDMNTLVALGAGASFGVSCIAAGLPQLGWKTFFEEPAMLLGFVLVGRALEERAKLQASADMAALQGLLPPKARLLLANGDWRQVPSENVSPGDLLVLFPGDCIPVDGVVVSGCSSVNESALTGEPMPVSKGEAANVTAGTVNCDGKITQDLTQQATAAHQVRAVRSGNQTAIADILRMVETAQARTAPVQRLADAVAGKFAYAVMGVSAATFAFWATVGTRIFPQVLSRYGGMGTGTAGSLLLSLQLACNVLVVACPCALGLAAPTAVLVGTSSGARRGLLIRGGDVLEATSQVDTVVFDKTGTLTQGRPCLQATHPTPGSPFSPHLLLAYAAAVERCTTHPVAQAIVHAASNSGEKQLEVEDGTFRQEPGSGVSGIVQGSAVAVGNLEWVQSHSQTHSTAQHPTPLPSQHSDGQATSISGGGLDNTSYDQHQQRREENLQSNRISSSSDRSSSSSSSSSDISSSSSSRSSDGADSGNSNVSTEMQDRLNSNAGASSRQAGSSNSGLMRVYVALNGKLAGCFEISDQLRSDAAATIRGLQQQGLDAILLSGDQAATAAAVAAAVGIPSSKVYSGVKPAGKAQLIQKLQGEGRRVAMVGDGVNDAAALAQADVGIAMGGGVDAASEVANIVLLGDKIPQVLDAIQLSHATFRKIRQNLWWAFGYNLVGIPLAAGALLPSMGIALTPSLSGALMGLSSLAVMGNSLTLQLQGRPSHHASTAASNSR